MMERLDEYMEHLRAFSAERDWDQFHTPENLAKSVSIEAGELLECYQWDSDADVDAVKDEIADVMGYSLMMCDRLGLDPVEILEAKLKKNITKYPVEKCKGRNTKYDKL